MSEIRYPVGKPAFHGGSIYQWFTLGVDTVAVGRPTFELVRYNASDLSEEWSSGRIDARCALWATFVDWVQDVDGIKQWAAWPEDTRAEIDPLEPQTLLTGDLFLIDSLHGVVIAYDLANEVEAWRIDTSIVDELNFFRILGVDEAQGRLICANYRQKLRNCLWQNLDHLDFSNFPGPAWQNPVTVDRNVRDIAENHAVQHCLTSHRLTDGAQQAEHIIQPDVEEQINGNGRWEEVADEDDSRVEASLENETQWPAWADSPSLVPYHEKNLVGVGPGGDVLPESKGSFQSHQSTVGEGYQSRRGFTYERLKGVYTFIRNDSSDHFTETELAAASGNASADLKLHAASTFEAHIQWDGGVRSNNFPGTDRTWLNMRISEWRSQERTAHFRDDAGNLGVTSRTFYNQQSVLGGFASGWTFPAGALNYDDVLVPEEVRDDLSSPGLNDRAPFPTSVIDYSDHDTREPGGSAETEPVSGYADYAHIQANQYLWDILIRGVEYYVFERSQVATWDPYLCAVCDGKIVFAPAARPNLAGNSKWKCFSTVHLGQEWERQANSNNVAAVSPIIVGDKIISALSDGASRVCQLNLDTGVIEASVFVPQGPVGEPFVSGDKFFFEADNGDLYSVNLVEA